MTDTEQCDISVDFHSDQLRLINVAAGMCDQAVSDFVIDAAFNKAVKTILTDKVAFISDEAYRAACLTILRLES